MKRKMNVALLLAGAAAGVLLSACNQKEENADTAEAVVSIEKEAVQAEEPQAEVSEDKETKQQMDEIDMPISEAPDDVRVYGQIKEILEGQILIENDNEKDPYRQILLNISDDTMILDAVNAEEKTLEDMKNGETLYAYVSLAMTRSLPPMSNAEVIFCGIPSDTAAPEYAGIVSIEKSEDGSYRLITNRDIIYHVNEETEILDFTSREKMEASQIAEGDKVIAWYQIVMESFPAQTAPAKMIVMR